jgi:putative membrane protein
MLWVKALHIVFVVTWFAGLFYIVRLFIYHTEAASKEEPGRSILINQYKLMESRLWYGITWPSMLLTWIFGLWYAFELYGIYFPSWLWLKLGLVLGLTLYHLNCQRMFNLLKKDQLRYSSFALRLWNEVTTLFLVAIVFIVVLKDLSKWWWGLAGLAIIALLMMLAVYIFKKRRAKKQTAGTIS